MIITLAFLFTLVSHLNAATIPLFQNTFHTTSALLTRLLHLSTTCPYVQAHWAQASSQASSSHLLVITLSRKQTPATLITFGEHGRELITSELALHLVQSHCHIPPKTTFVLIPVANPFSRTEAELSPCARLNNRAVDLNRNYPTSVDVFSTHPEEPAGPFPLSEPETRIVDAVAKTIHPVAYISVHSGDHAVLYPFDNGRMILSNSLSKQLAKLIKQRHCGNCRIGTAKDLFGYRAFGTAVDYMVETLGVPAALTVEIFGNQSAHRDDCRQMFNPMSQSLFQEVLSNWSTLLDSIAAGLLEEMGDHWRVTHVLDVQASLRASVVNGVQFVDVGERTRVQWVASVCILVIVVALALVPKVRKGQKGRRLGS